jgi:uncharacterized membrane protein (UPF0127 family)
MVDEIRERTLAHSMQVINTTRNHTLATAARLADNPLTRFIGLLGRRAFPAGQALILRGCSGIHMFGMRFAIDALYLDAAGCVVRAISALAPWRVGPLDPAAECIIELPAGTIAATATTVGDQITLVPPP